MMVVKVSRRGDKIIVNVDGSEMQLTPEQAYILVRKIGSIFGLRVTVGKPILSVTRAPGGVTVTMIEGSHGVRRYFVSSSLLEAYIAAIRRLGPGRYRYYEVVRAAFVEAVKRGVDGVKKYISYPPEEAWQMLFGARSDYYQYFRVPMLVLQEMGCAELGRKYIKIKKC